MKFLRDLFFKCRCDTSTRKGFNVCIVHPKNAPHRGVFDELAELINYSLIDLSFSSEWGYNQINRKKINIVIGMHLISDEMYKSIPKCSIFFNTEQMESVRVEWKEIILKIARERRSIVDYSLKNIDYFNERGVGDVRLFKFGYQPDLERIEQAKIQDIDVLFYGTMNPRRQKIIDAMRVEGLVVQTLYGVYGKERDDWIARSKLVLNIHFYPSEILEVVRLFYLCINKVLVLTELNETTFVDDTLSSRVIGVPYRQLVERAVELCRDEDVRCQYRRRLFVDNSADAMRQLIHTREIVDGQ